MHELEKEIIELGAIDTDVKRIQIDEWFETVIIEFIGKNDIGNVICTFENCYEISLKHDRTYKKGKNKDGGLDYKYFIQDIEIIEDKGDFVIKISAWPLNGEIVCKNIHIDIDNH